MTSLARRWDGTCATLESETACRINPATGKDLRGRILPGADFTYRALVLSFSDVDPIPDGELYCCTFTVEAEPGGCCRVAVAAAGASDPTGRALSVRGGSGQLCVQGGPVAGTPTPTRGPGDSGAGPDNSGCQTVPPNGGPVLPAWVVVAAVLLFFRRGARSRHPRSRWRAERVPGRAH